jgi:hypothetical protein
MKDIVTRGSITAAVVAIAVAGAGAIGYSVGDRRTTQPAVVEQVLPAVPSAYLPAPPSWEPVILNPRLQVEEPAVDTLTPIRPAHGGSYR